MGIRLVRTAGTENAVGADVLTLVPGRAWARVWERNGRGRGRGRTAVQTDSSDFPRWSPFLYVHAALAVGSVLAFGGGSERCRDAAWCEWAFPRLGRTHSTLNFYSKFPILSVSLHFPMGCFFRFVKCHGCRILRLCQFPWSSPLGSPWRKELTA